MKTFIVGGAVRDQLLGQPVKDRDWVVVGETTAAMLAAGFKQVGKDFPVFLHPESKEEYALARTERKTGAGYLGFDVDASPEVTLEQDLSRRDLTINAIAKDKYGELIDPYGGVHDIEDRILRHVSPAFKEDPVRILRLARFLARYQFLGFSVAHETSELILEMINSGEVDHLVPERVWQETKTALSESSPGAYFLLLKQAGALSVIMPSLNEHSEEHLVSLNVIHHGIARFALLCATLDQDALNHFCDQLKVSNDYRRIALKAQRIISNIPSATATDILDALDRIDFHRQPDDLPIILETLYGSQALGYVYEDTGVMYLEEAAKMLTAFDTKTVDLGDAKGIEIRHKIDAARHTILEGMLEA